MYLHPRISRHGVQLSELTSLVNYVISHSQVWPTTLEINDIASLEKITENGLGLLQINQIAFPWKS